MPHKPKPLGQAAKQRALWRFKRLRPLDFSPFEPALQDFAPRAGRVSRLVSGKTIPELRGLLDGGALSSVDLTLHYLLRIKRQSKLNAVNVLNAQVLVLARAADAVPNNQRGHMHGIPVLVKDNIATGDGMPNSAGAAVLIDALPDRDAYLVTRLRAAGALILGKANLSEWANFMADEPPPNGFSAVGGQTRNPHGPFDVGGSSSGSGSATAAGLCAAAVGTETWGSVVNPSLHNGLYGLKPSLGLISRDRIIPITDVTDTAGPMARTLADLAALMNALTGYDRRDPACRALAASAQGKALFQIDFAGFLTVDGLRGKRIGVLPCDGKQPAGSARIHAQIRKRLASAGATVVDVQMPRFKNRFLALMAAGLLRGVARYLRETAAPVKSVAEVIAFNETDPARRSPNGMGRMRWAASEKPMTVAEYGALAAKTQADARAYIDRLMRKHRLDLLLDLDSNGPGSMFVLAGAPLLTLPVGVLPNGAPAGCTLACRWLGDGALLAAGAAFAHAAQPKPKQRRANK
jgi:amidase